MKTNILYWFLLSASSIYSQNSEPIQADRPDQTETPAIVPKGMFQVETGLVFQKNDANSSTFSLPSTLWKYGVNENFELRLLTEFISEAINYTKTSGLNPIYVGFKVQLTEEKGIIPKTSYIAQIGFPNAASSPYKTAYFAPEFRLVMQHSLSEKLAFSYNLGAEWDGFSAVPTYIYTAATGYSVTKKTGVYFEVFGFIPQQQKPSHNLDGGITYLINNNLMLDLSSSIGISKNAPKNYFAFGFSFRL